jgi:hypothetical protein
MQQQATAAWVSTQTAFTACSMSAHLDPCILMLSPRRCSQDLVEVPSHLWEHFIAAPQSLALLARHKGSREAMPAKLSEVLCRGWSSFSSVTPALELQQQVRMAGYSLLSARNVRGNKTGRAQPA